MNTRRQKIWLVSMLSLMVLLSAYYLFTDDMSRDMPSAQGGDQATSDDLGYTYDSQFISDDEFAITDEDILAEYESMQVSAGVLDQFDALYAAREEGLKEQFDEINRIITDPSQTTETMTQAYTELDTLEQQYLVVQHLEELLMEDYGDAIITPEEGKWHVRVLAENMEKSQAVSIIETVAEQLGVANRDVFVTMMN